MEVLCLIGGFVLGVVVVMASIHFNATTGEFKINETNPEEEYMSLHLDNQDHLYTKNYIWLKIVHSENTSK